MSFKQQLERLTEIANTRQPGIREDRRMVDKRDLKDLIYYFNMVDRDFREALPQLKAEQARGAELEATIAAMRSALEPFANVYIYSLNNDGTQSYSIDTASIKRAQDALSGTANIEYPVKMVKRTIQAGSAIFNEMGEVIPGAYQAFTKHVEVRLPYCGQCGKVIDDIAQKYCGWCGVRINTECI